MEEDVGVDTTPEPDHQVNNTNHDQRGETAVRGHRVVIGVLILLLVDIIWVASSELTEFIFKTQHYSKPFFSTYLKTSLFMLYLPGFLFYAPWREQCQWSQVRHRRTLTRSGGAGYSAIQESDDTDAATGASDTGDDSDNDEENSVHSRSVNRSLSEPSFQPIKNIQEGTDSEADTGRRRVRFNKVAEVRSLSAKEALHANLARLSYAASLRAQAALQRAQNRLTVAETAKLALTFSLLWFMGNYSYQAALADTEAGVVNVLSSTSCFFTMILSACFPSNNMDRLSLTKVVGVAFTISGVVLVSYSDLSLEKDLPLGAVWTLAGALFYSSYIVFLRRKIDHEDKLDVPMFFGFVGLFSFLLLWPLFFLLHYTQYELFQLPNRVQLIALLVNGIVGTVMSELLWMFGCFYSSSLIATLSISLTIPLTTFADVLVKKVSYDKLFYIGSIPMFVSFFLVAMVSHWNNWDPILDGIKYLWRIICKKCCGLRQVNQRVNLDSLENESLLQNHGETTETDISSQTAA